MRIIKHTRTQHCAVCREQRTRRRSENHNNQGVCQLEAHNQCVRRADHRLLQMARHKHKHKHKHKQAPFPPIFPHFPPFAPMFLDTGYITGTLLGIFPPTSFGYF